MKDILLIVEDLDLNGAQVVLWELLQLDFFKKKKIELISPDSGEFEKKYRSMGIEVTIRPYISGSIEFRKHLQSDYKIVIINTAPCYLYLTYFINTQVPVFFWLHETITQLENAIPSFIDPRLYSPNIHMLAVTEAVKDGVIKKYGDVDIKSLPMPIADICKKNYTDIKLAELELLKKVDGRVLFFFPAAYSMIKGQDILLQAILRMPIEYRNKAHFILCGYNIPSQNEYYEMIKRIADNIPEVTIMGKLSRNDVYFWYSVCDCVLAPSRIDATPTSIIEGAMFRKASIVSDAAGISKYLEDGVSGFIFPSENVDELVKRLIVVISKYKLIGFVGENARSVYEKNFFPEHVNDLLEQFIIEL